MCVIIAMKWVENYGDSTATTLHSFGAALTAIKTGQWQVHFGCRLLQLICYTLAIMYVVFSAQLRMWLIWIWLNWLTGFCLNCTVLNTIYHDLQMAVNSKFCMRRACDTRSDWGSMCCNVTDYKILCLGLIQSLFEGSMYCYRLQDPVPRTYPVPVWRLNVNVLLQITGSCASDLSSPCLKAQCIVTDYKILCLGLIQSLFEGSMYTFVLEWTPALTPADMSPANAGAATSSSAERATIPHGYIFAGFMASIWIVHFE